MQYVYGVLKLSPREFWDMTPAETELTILGHRRQDQIFWQRIRRVGVILVNGTGRYNRPIEAHELFFLDGDLIPEPEEPMTHDDLKALAARFGRVLN